MVKIRENQAAFDISIKNSFFATKTLQNNVEQLSLLRQDRKRLVPGERPGKAIPNQGTSSTSL